MTLTPAPPTPAPPTPAPAPRRSGSRILGPWLVVLGLVCAATTVYLLSGYVPPDPDRSRVPVTGTAHFALLLVHIGTGSVALLLGPLQFVPWLRRRHPAVHRRIGRTYLALGVVPSAIVGVPVALLSAYGPVPRAAFALLSLTWLVTAVAGYRAARQRRFDAHREWMIRNVVLTLSAVTFRSWLGLLIVTTLPQLRDTYDGDFETLFRDVYGAAAWLSWVPSLLVAECLLRWRPRP
ncbi:DUF2306 domain-containing protein [Pseudonocardia sp. GCM10023141]|uniref:DUF2306 domain-containing protein n=1 Tax=Pseudonocardia sp. GCM10023141 TaxID=3252653 RepID=UPI00361D012F